MNRPSNIIFCNNGDQMNMVWHNHISVDCDMKMLRDVLQDSVHDFATSSQLRFGRFMNRPYSIIPI